MKIDELVKSCLVRKETLLVHNPCSAQEEHIEFSFCKLGELGHRLFAGSPYRYGGFTAGKL